MLPHDVDIPQNIWEKWTLSIMLYKTKYKKEYLFIIIREITLALHRKRTQQY